MTHSSGPSPEAAEAIRRWRHVLEGRAETGDLRQPDLVEAAGAALASALAGSGIDTVLTWDDTDHAVLGHVLARELEARRIELYEAQGTVELSEQLRSDAGCLVAAPAFDETNHVRAAVGAVISAGARLVAIGCVRGTPVLRHEAPVSIRVVELIPPTAS